ncbi:outer membrane protein OmpK [Halomonas beimenensis]|uniref:Putative exported protein n=1 Tax=Halomonas beimenensis TaxID=475662 RepID=A0A291P9R3_9GAMM|nr:outer membrane protein OmpK [Halomonas beimenensis]ATJ83592.1 putative exported protein precursor [Halomonas beimenensis]
MSYPARRLPLTIASLLAGLAPIAQADALTPNWSFANASVNYLDWSGGTEERTATNAAKSDFVYLELEGGAGFDWGELYGFFDAENPNHGSFDERSGGKDNFRTAAKVTSHFYLGDSPFSLYAHVYDFRDHGFDVREQDQVLGLGYRHTFANGLWIKPFLGPARVQSSGYTGMNGYIGGWVAGYDFHALGQRLSLTNWHEQTFARDDAYLTQNFVGEKAGSTGTNGAVALWWHPVETITTGVQYRYADEKLGTPGAYQNALIYSLKLNFL